VIRPHSLVVGTPCKVIRDIPERLESIHNQALKYKTLWSQRWGLAPDLDGERYVGGQIV